MDDVFTKISRDPKYQKANVDYLIKKLRNEFDKIGSVRPLCKRSLTLSTSVSSAAKKRPQLKTNQSKKPSRKRSESTLPQLNSIF